MKDFTRTEEEMLRCYAEACELGKRAVINFHCLSLCTHCLSVPKTVHRVSTDDEGTIHPDEFLEVCHNHNIGLGVHPVRRGEMIKALRIAKGETEGGNFVGMISESD